MSTAIEARELTIRFGDFTAVNHVSFAVQEGEVFGLLGPNGSGKTTIIKALCALIPVHSGSGHILGLDAVKQAASIRRRIGYMSQKFGLYEDLTVRENIGFYAGVYGLEGEKREQRMQSVVDLTQIRPYLDRRAGKLSGGWKQRLALACAIIHEPRVVFLDEPTAGIDPVARRALWDLIFALSGEGVTFFVTTHYMDEAERCGRIGYIYNSRLIAVGTVDEIKDMEGVNPRGSERVAIATPNAAAALGVLRKAEYVREATLFGQDIHALIDTGAASLVQDDLQAAGFAPVSIEAIRPSLEDAFVTLTNQIVAQGASQ